MLMRDYTQQFMTTIEPTHQRQAAGQFHCWLTVGSIFPQHLTSSYSRFGSFDHKLMTYTLRNSDQSILNYSLIGIKLS